jgi:hypothetical protein
MILKRLNKKFLLINGLALLVVAAVGFFLRHPPGPRPLCGRAFDGAFQEWMVHNHITNRYYPNTNGNGSASLAATSPYFGEVIKRYGYIPGLRWDDPKDLVLMYLKVKTRYTWHGDMTPNIFSPKLWKIVPPSVVDDGPDPEGGELVTTPEFKKRILKTLVFLKENQRPYWQTVATEQMQFLDSIKE